MTEPGDSGTGSGQGLGKGQRTTALAPPAAARNIVGVVLAGGQSRRMGGGNKWTRSLGGKLLIDHAVDRLRPQVSALAVNANSQPDALAHLNCPILADEVSGYPGPMAGILTAMRWTATREESNPGPAGGRWMVTVACDAPFFPLDLVERLAEAVRQEGADMACAASGSRHHPVFALWPSDLADDLRRHLVDLDIRKVDRWTARYRCALVEFPVEPFDPFMNINRPEDLAEAERLVARTEPGSTPERPV